MSTVTGFISASSQLDEWIEVVRKQVESLRFGTVQITVHESRVVQIDTTEKFRFAHSSSINQPEQSAAGKNQISITDRDYRRGAKDRK